MSANNYLEISKSEFTVYDKDIERGNGSFVGRGKTLEEAIEIAERYDEGLDDRGFPQKAEYGIKFVD
jgi:hypothetical protein